MKILSNFDTKLDKKIFLKKVKKYGNGNVLLVKRHPLFLYKAFLNGVLAFLLFIILISILYLEYEHNIKFFYIFSILHLIGLGFWLITLFKKIISHLWSYKEFIQDKNDLKDIDLGDFGKFIKHSLILFLYQFIISIIDNVVLLNIDSNAALNISWGIAMFVINTLFLVLIIKILRRFVDFEMDFITVTPDEIESVNQTGIFKREVVSLDLNKVRSISTEKDGFFKSLFNIGSLVILSEGDSGHHGEVQFNYIHRLGKLKKAVLEIIHKSKKKKEKDNN